MGIDAQVINGRPPRKYELKAMSHNKLVDYTFKLIKGQDFLKNRDLKWWINRCQTLKSQLETVGNYNEMYRKNSKELQQLIDNLKEDYRKKSCEKDDACKRNRDLVIKLEHAEMMLKRSSGIDGDIAGVDRNRVLHLMNLERNYSRVAEELKDANLNVEKSGKNIESLQKQVFSLQYKVKMMARKYDFGRYLWPVKKLVRIEEKKAINEAIVFINNNSSTLRRIIRTMTFSSLQPIL